MIRRDQDPLLPKVDDDDVATFAADNVERYGLLADCDGLAPRERSAFRRLLALWLHIHKRFAAPPASKRRSV